MLFRVMNIHQRCLQVKNRNDPKQVLPKSKNLSRSLEKYFWTFDKKFPTIFNNKKACRYITFKCAVKHRQLSEHVNPFVTPWSHSQPRRKTY